MENNQKSIVFRKPSLADAAGVRRLIADSPPLDMNSLYCYLLICTHFYDTSVIAENDKGIAGFISGYLSPSVDHTLFIWQVVVAKESQKQGLAKAMLEAILSRHHKIPIRYLETTVNPTNKASRSLFYSLAQSLNADCKESVLFSETDFGGEAHEDEILYRIGPFDTTQ